VWYIALTLIVAVTHTADADFLSCTSNHRTPQGNNLRDTIPALGQIFSRLTSIEAFSLNTEPARLAVEQGSAPHAFVRGTKEIVVTTELLGVVKDPSELAFVLAHELSHLAIGHTRPGDATSELQADRLALTLVRRAGFDPCASLSVLARLGAPYAASLESLTPRMVALRRINEPLCSGIPLIHPHHGDRLEVSALLTLALQQNATDDRPT
jgi:predicted Zn-dependent protease